MKRRILPLSLATTLLVAHPMGNFTVSHYTRLDVSDKAVNVTYVLDLAEVPTFQLLRNWKLEPNAGQSALDQKAVEQAHEWMRNLDFRSRDERVEPAFVRAEIKLADGAAGQQVARITTVVRVNAKGSLTFEDRNFPERAGWK